MQRIRKFEMIVVELFARGKIPGFLHTYVGEGAVAAGVCAALRPDDKIISTHRGLAAPIERVGAKDSPIPFSPILEHEILPDDQDIVDAVYRAIDYAT